MTLDIQKIIIDLQVFFLSPTMQGILLLFVVILILGFLLKKFPDSRVMIVFDMLYEKVAAFYGDILWEWSSEAIKTYIVALFFVIFLANILGVIIDFVAPVFWTAANGEFFLANYITIPTADMQFNIALSLFSVVLLIYIQFRSLWTGGFLYNYFPVWGKWYIVVEKGKMNRYLYILVAGIAKVGDIIISLFLWFLDIIGLFAKIISLGFRLFGNMTSGTVLLGMLIVWVSSWSNSMTAFIGGIDFPIIAPIIVYLQAFLVACIQAMVFPLLVAIFIRMASLDGESSKQVEA